MSQEQFMAESHTDTPIPDSVREEAKRRAEQKPETPVEELQVVFDVVGNFEPSYTEYITEYILAEFWLPGEQGYLIHTTKGAHQNKIITGEKAK